jgi:hypothetical protein
MRHAECGGNLTRTYGHGNYRCEGCKDIVRLGDATARGAEQLERRFSLWAQREQRKKDKARENACPHCWRTWGCNCDPIESEDWLDFLRNLPEEDR